MPNAPLTDHHRLEQLLTAGHSFVAVRTVEEEYAMQEIAAAAMNLGRDLLAWSVTRGLHDGLITGGIRVPDTEHPAAALFHLAERRDASADVIDVARPTNALIVFLDLIGHLKDERTCRALREAVRAVRDRGGAIILIDASGELPPALEAKATPFEFLPPDDAELEQIIKSTLRECHDRRPIRVDVNRQQLRQIVKNLRGLTRRQVKQIIADAVCEDRTFDEQDVNGILARKRRALGEAGLLEYVESPADLSQIGGMNRLKQWLCRRAAATSERAQQFGLAAPRGVLMLGVQGAGKSLAAKAVATAWQWPLLRMDVGALYDKYIGESEKRLRDTLAQAERMAPIVLWVDEIDKAFASVGGNNSNDGGLSKRMFATLLTWMQERSAPVFLIATANDIESLPPELMRKGRFDEIFFVDLPNLEARRAIFEIHIRKRGREPKHFDLDSLAEQSAGFSGAEIEQAIVASLHDAFDAEQQQLTTSHIQQCLASSPPLSVTMREKIDYLRAWSHGRCVPAD